MASGTKKVESIRAVSNILIFHGNPASRQDDNDMVLILLAFAPPF